MTRKRLKIVSGFVVNSMIMAQCVSGKKMYASQEVAEDVLIETRTRFEFALNHGPIAVYKCEDCGQYHLTSKGIMNGKLSKALSEGKIHLQKEANKWLDKWKRR